jgi:hypothetical protein
MHRSLLLVQSYAKEILADRIEEIQYETVRACPAWLRVCLCVCVCVCTDMYTCA